MPEPDDDELEFGSELEPAPIISGGSSRGFVRLIIRLPVGASTFILLGSKMCIVAASQ